MYGETGAVDGLDLAARHLEKMMSGDSSTPSLGDRLAASGPVSGLQDRDYPGLAATGPEGVALRQGTRVKRVPLPAELVEHFSHMQCNCNMGLFPEVQRAWLTIDSDIYVWRYEDSGDLAYFDGLTDTILNVALVTPKPGILQPHIKYLLCLTTPVEIVLLGVSFASPVGGDSSEMHLLPEPLFSLPSDQLQTRSVAGAANGRIFLGGRDGSLYEFAYQADDGWFGKKAKKINHSSNVLSFLVPNFLGSALQEEDPIAQIIIDDSRNILYTRSEKGTVQVFDMGQGGDRLDKVTAVTAATLVQEASKLATTVEANNLRPVIHLAAIPRQEDDNIHLVAVTGGGARLYLSTRSAQENNRAARPYMLRLVHVRLPPGFAPSAPPQKPSKVHTAYYREGLALLAASPAQAADVLWLLWNGSLPVVGPSLMEGQSTVSVDGHTWAMDEVVTPGRLERLYRNSFNGRDPTPSVIQHCSASRQLVVLSAQGALLVSALRPVDCLRQLLIDCGGPEAEAVKSYFTVQGGEQAAATSLVLATSQAIIDRQVADWAARAFFLYGGEPRLVYPTNQGFSQAAQFHGGQSFQSPGQFMAASPTTSFHPNIMSTPAPPTPQQYNYPTSPGYQHHPLPELKFSFRHNGLYLYLSRLLRPVWTSPLVTGSPEQPSSSISHSELEFIMSQLHDLRAFLERNSALSSGGMDGGSQHSTVPQQRSQQDALLREKQYLILLRQLVIHSLQVLGLWAVVVNHQLHLVIASLSNDNKNLLRQLAFRDMVVTPAGRDIATTLVHSLVARYLGDAASTDAISAKLREVCPGLYRAEDALSNKAHELLIAAGKSTNAAESAKMVKEAVGIAKQIAGHLKLEVLVSHLAACRAYTSVVEICMAAASKRDQQGLALHYYKSGENQDDTAGLAAFLARADCYKHCTEMLKTLLESGNNAPTSPSVPKSPGPPPPIDPAHLQPSQATEAAEQVFQMILASDDQLLHVCLYQWLIENKYLEKLLDIRSPFIEEYLKSGTTQHPETLAMFDLLWKYYEKNKEYVAAARILSKLADRHSTELHLGGRVEYLSRAVMCVKSSEGGGSASRAAGELLHHLEEKMEVARVQLQVQEAVAGMPGGGAQLARLNSDLLDITSLYQDWAEPYQLWECKLAILACAGHPDPMLIENIWSNIITCELDRLPESSNNTKILSLSQKMETLGRMYAGSTKYFPVEFLVKILEVTSCRLGGDPGVVIAMMQGVGVDIPRLLDVYNRLYLAKDPIWLTEGNSLHLLTVLCSLLSQFAASPDLVALGERRQFNVVCQDAVATYLGELYMRQDTQQLIQAFRDIQAKLDRIFKN